MYVFLVLSAIVFNFAFSAANHYFQNYYYHLLYQYIKIVSENFQKLTIENTFFYQN